MCHSGPKVQNLIAETKLPFKNEKDGVLFLKELSVFVRKISEEESKNLKSFVSTYVHRQ